MLTRVTYTLNSKQKPSIRHDNGFLDRFPSRKPTLEEKANYLKWRAMLEAGEAIQDIPFIPKNNLPDALAAYRHFLNATNEKRQINIERYFKHDSAARITLRNAGIEARNAAYSLYTKNYFNKNTQFTFVSSVLKAGGQSPLFPYPDTENWQKAIGAFSFWLTGDVVVTIENKKPYFDLLFTFHMEDMYNFNPGQADIATGIPDSENGIFSITGLAKQYLNIGQASREALW